MKKILSLLYCWTLVLYAHAEDPPQLETARAAFQKRCADALRPVYDAYIRELQAMEGRLSLRQDVNGALAVRQEREAIEEELKVNPPSKINFLTGTVWQWGGPQSGGTIEFRRDGTVYNDGWDKRGLVTGWEYKGGGVVLLTILKGRSDMLYAILVFAPDRRSYTGTGFECKLVPKSTKIRKTLIA